MGAGPSFRNSPDTILPEVKGSINGIIGTISVLLVIVVLVMGGIFIYKRKCPQTDCNISMHFQNPKTAFDAAKLRICQMPEMVRGSSRLNEIFVNGRQDTTKVPVSQLQINHFATEQRNNLINTRKYGDFFFLVRRPPLKRPMIRSCSKMITPDIYCHEMSVILSTFAV